MMKKIFFACVALCFSLSLGSVDVYGQKLYPVQGPEAAKNPQPVYKGKIHRKMWSGVTFSMVVSWTLADGMPLTGTPKTVPVNSTNEMPANPANFAPQPNLAFAWDAVYGQGFFTAHILGGKILQGVYRGTDGTVLQIESGDMQSGVAVDNRGNIYKMVWK